MKSFFKMLLASILGVFIATGICFILFIGVITALVSFDKTPVEVKPNSILKISLNKPVVDRTTDNPLEGFDPFSLSVQTSIGLNDVLKSINRASTDPNIKGIYLDLTSVLASPATVEEIRTALIRFKQSGKFIISYGDNYSQLGYYLATVADKVYLHPYASFQLLGMRSEIMFYKGLLDKLNVDVQIIRHGKFKSAIEPFVNEKMSPENREQVMAYMGSIWSHITQAISATRNIDVAEINKAANQLEMHTAEDALSKGYVDGLLYKDQLITELCNYTDKKTEKDLALLDISDYKTTPDPNAKYSKNKIAIVYAQGQIFQGTGNKEIMADDISRAIRKARTDTDVKAIVFRINSPGGDAQASEIIARELELAKQDKPVVISMGDLAASGGYWVSTPGSYIFSNHTTITGSIGVFGMIPNIQKGMQQLTGITVDVAKTNDHADMMTIFRPLEPVEKEYFQRTVENIYDKFITKVATSRNMSKESVDSIGQGRVWSGDNAFGIGLIDAFGGLDDAILHAVEMAGVSEYRISELPEAKSPFEQIMSSMSSSIKGQFGRGDLQRTFEQYENLLHSIENPGVQARMPYDVKMY